MSDRENYLKQHGNSLKADLPPKALDDLRFYAKAAAEGRTLSWRALSEWMASKHKVTMGRRRLATVAEQHGIKPWWSSSA